MARGSDQPCTPRVVLVKLIAKSRRRSVQAQIQNAMAQAERGSGPGPHPGLRALCTAGGPPLITATVEQMAMPSASCPR